MTTHRRLLAILLYLVFLAGLCEIPTRLAFSVPRLADRLPATEADRWRNQWLARHEATGTEIYYAFDDYDPTKGWISKPNLRDRVVFGDKVLNTNSRGLRGTDEHAPGKHPEKQRLLVIGDSFTFGDEVSDDETYSHYLQQMLPQAEVVNMGMHGYGNDQMLIFLEEEGARYAPDIVILGFVSTDMARNMLDFRDYAKPKYAWADGALTLTNTPVPRPEDTLARDGSRIRSIEMLAGLWEMLERATGRYDRKVETMTTAILAKIAAAARGIGATPLFAFLPTGLEMADPAPSAAETYLLSACAASVPVECFSARPSFAAKVESGADFNPYKHWPPLGHQAAAEAIRDHLIAAGHIARP